MVGLHIDSNKPIDFDFKSRYNWLRSKETKKT